MKIYSITNLLSGIAFFAGVLFSTTSCTAVDYTLGDNLIPNGQQMNTGIDSSFRVHTSLFKLDSINASNNKPVSISVGSYIDPLVGRVSGQAFSEFSTVSFGVGKELKTDYFGKNPVCDSIFLFIDVLGAKGDTLTDRQFEVFRVNHKFSLWADYYTNFVMPASYLSATPLAIFNARKADIIKVALPIEFGRELMETTQDPTQSPYYSDSLFHQKFNGFYFRGNFEASATDPGNMININMTSESKIRLYYRNDNLPDKDTVYSAVYSFQVNPGNASIEMVQHDYSFSDQAAGGINPAQINKPDIETEYCYAQGMAGVGTMVNFSTQQINDFKAKIMAKWPGYNSIAINRAILRANLVDHNWINYNKSYVRLGMYYDITQNKFIPDYHPIQENPPINAVFYFDGYLNRSLGYYEMDITSYFQKLINSSGDGSVQQSLQMLPAYNENLLIQRSQMYGSASAAQLAPQMIITYTVLR